MWATLHFCGSHYGAVAGSSCGRVGALARFQRWTEAPGCAHALPPQPRHSSPPAPTPAAGKGGVGKSTFSAQLAFALAARGLEVCVGRAVRQCS